MTRVLADKYELYEVLGAGTTGEVHRARHRALDRPCAIKLLHPHVVAQPDAVQRFRREARAAARLEHPNVVQVTDFGEDAGAFFIVMEHLVGQSLSRWLEREGVPSLKLVEFILAQVLDALAAAHGMGIVHRDLKPDNVLLVDGQDGPRAKLVDFGLAHLDEPEEGPATLTRRDAVAGTPAYMSPEQCRSLRVAASADLYAVGCLLTELLQLRPPFGAASPIDVISQQLFVPPPPLDRPPSAEPVPPLLEALRLKLLAKLPHERPPTAAVTRERLRRACDSAANDAELPDRKGGEPRGARGERSPDWAAGHVAVPASSGGPWPIAAGGPGAGLDEADLTGLAAQGLIVHRTSLEGLELRGARVFVLDLGVAADRAPDILPRLRERYPELRIVICTAELSAPALTRLIEAGAADVVRYPLTPSRLGPKLARLLR